MASYRVLMISLVLLLHFSLARAANATAVTADGCVSPVAFKVCVDTALAVTIACANVVVGHPILVAACAYAFLEDEIDCYLSSCWNKVYSCEYQAIAAVVSDGVLAPVAVPFYPAPDNAPGGCSCNIGKLHDTVSSYNRFTTQSCQYPNKINNLADVGACDCCGASAALSSFYGLCPTSDQNAILLTDALQILKGYEAGFGTTCAKYFDAPKCVSQFSFSPVPGGTFYPPDNLPPWTGTNPLSTTGSPLTSLPSGGPTITWTGAGAVFTRTAAPYSAVNSPGTGGGAAATAVTAAGGPSSVGAGGATFSGAQTTTKASGAVHALTRSPTSFTLALLVLATLFGQFVFYG